MAFVVDLLPPSPAVEAAAGLGLALSGRKGKGFLGRRQYEEIEVLARFSLPLKTVSWFGSDKGCRSLAFDPHGLVPGGVRFGLDAAEPVLELTDDVNEEGFVGLCQELAKRAVDFKTQTLEIPGLITQPGELSSLIKGEPLDYLVLELEQPVDPEAVHQQLQEQLKAYGDVIGLWEKTIQDSFAFRDQLTVKIEDAARETREASEVALAELNAEVEASIATKQQEIEVAQVKAESDSASSRKTLEEELERAQERFKETGEALYRDQIKAIEKRIADADRDLSKVKQGLVQALNQHKKQQQDRIKQFTTERDKRLAAFDQRVKRLDSSVEGLKKGVEKRLEKLQSQPDVVTALTVELPPERCANTLLVDFFTVRYPGNRWKVFGAQKLGDKGILGKLSGLVGGTNLPFASASKVTEKLAEKLEAMIPQSELADKLAEVNLLEEEFTALARKGINQLIEQGQADKKTANLFA